MKCEFKWPKNNLERRNCRKYKEYTKDNLQVRTRSNFLGVGYNYDESHTINASPFLNGQTIKSFYKLLDYCIIPGKYIV